MDRPALRGHCVTRERVLAYLGPEGSFTHSATGLVSVDVAERVPMPDVKSVVNAVENGQVMFGVVPIENSVDGEVTSTVDEFVFGTLHTYAREEVVLPVSFDAFVVAADAAPKFVVSHPVALAQCRRFIEENGLVPVTASSTSAACRELAESGRTDMVALGSTAAGKTYGLTPYRTKVEDNSRAHTRFVLLSQRLEPRRPGTDYRCWVAVIPPSNRVGVLAEILQFFADRGISLLSVTTRPLRAELGAYCFLLSFDGHIDDPGVQDVMGEIAGIGGSVKVLGSMRKWRGDGVVPGMLQFGPLEPLNAGFVRGVPHPPEDPA